MAAQRNLPMNLFEMSKSVTFLRESLKVVEAADVCGSAPILSIVFMLFSVYVFLQHQATLSWQSSTAPSTGHKKENI